MITIIFIALFLVIGGYIMNRNIIKKIQSKEFKVGFVKDNLGFEGYKILSQEKDNEFIEFEDNPYVRLNYLDKHITYLARQNYSTNEEAEKALNELKIHLKQEKYTRIIKKI